MSKRNKILVYFQILIILCTVLCNCVITSKSIRKSSVFNYKEGQCCCKLESDCTTCCCALDENKYGFQNNSKEQKNSFSALISSINCRLGNDPLTNINFVVKYLSEDQIQPIKETFLCFLAHVVTIYHPQEMVNLPEKPPRFLS